MLLLSAPVLLLDEGLKTVSRGCFDSATRACSWACTFCWRSRRYMGVAGSTSSRYDDVGASGAELQKLRHS